MAKQNKGRKFFAASATAALVASAIVPVASAAQVNDYNKISGYAKEAVQSLVDAGVIQGDTNGNFNPLNTVTRAQAAEIFTKALELEADGDVNFSDVKKGAWYYNSIAAVVANGIFEGVSAKEFAPNKSLTRSEAAKVLVDAFGLEGSESLSQFADASQVKPWAKDALETAVANGIFTGSEENGKLNLKPNAAITRQDFAVVFARTLDLVDAETPVEATSVKAINNTTVEVTFDEEVNTDNLKSTDFEISGLKVENASVKQTDKKVVVLRTEKQEADKEYTVSYEGNEVGKFKGVAAVIPTKIDVTTSSLQGVIGKEVTLKAQVTVPEGQSKEGIPVTFNIVNNQNTNEKIEKVAYTKADGVAEYSYTRYYSSEDSVAAYATDKASVVSSAKVYWADKIQLAVEEITTGNELANETKKSYKVKGAKNATYYIAIKENLDVTPDKVTDVKVQNQGSLNFVTPYELTTGGTQFATVITNADGEGAFTIYGTNLSATPIVYKPESTPTTPASFTYNKLDLQAQAPTVKFSQVDRLAVTVKSEGTANAAEYAQTPNLYNDNSVGGRTFTATVTDKEGKIAPEGTIAYVTFKDGNLSGDVYFSTAKDNFKKVAVDNVLPVRVGKEGKATFRLAGKGATTYVKPTVFLNTAGNVSPVKLDKTDVQQDAEVTYFKEAVVVNATLTVKDTTGKVITTQTAGQDAIFEYQSVDQNGFAYRPTRVTNPGSVTTGYVQQQQADGTIIWVPVQLTNAAQISNNFTLAFDVTSTFGNAIVKDATGTVLNANQNMGSTKTYNVTSNNNGTAQIYVTAQAADTVSVNATGAGTILPTASAKVSFTSGVSPSNLVGKTFKLNTTDKTFGLLANDGRTLFYDYEGANFKYNGNTISVTDFEIYLGLGAEVVVTDDNGVKTFNIIATNTTATLTLDNAVDYLVNEAVGKGLGSVTIDSTKLTGLGLAGAALNGNVTIDTLATINVSFEHSFTGNLDVTAPNAHVTIPATTTITGNVNIKDVSSSSFVNNGSITGNVVITDANGSRFVNNGNIAGKVEVKTKGAVKLGGNLVNKVIVTDSAKITTEGTNVTGIDIQAPGVTINDSTTSVFTATTSGDTVVLTFTANVTSNDVSVVSLTSGDTATATIAGTDAKAVVSFSNTGTAVTAKAFKVTYKGKEYEVRFNTTSNAWDVVAK